MCALLAGLIGAPLVPALPIVAREIDAQTPVLILYAQGRSTDGAEGLPRWVALETQRVLGELGGLRNVRVVGVGTSGDLVDHVRSSREEVLVIVGHADESGLEVGTSIVSWPALRDAIASSDAEHFFIGACFSEAAKDVPGKAVHTTFPGLVDHRIVPGQILSDMTSTLFPSLDFGMDEKLRSYAASLGGLDALARLVLDPQEPLQSNAQACNDKITRWHGGERLSTRGERCLALLSPASTNCHNASERKRAPCTDFTSQDQTRAMKQTTVSSKEKYGPSTSTSDGFEEASWDHLQKTFGLAWKGEYGTEFSFKVGAKKASDGSWEGIGPDQCVDILTVETLATGGIAAVAKQAWQALLKIVRKNAKAFSTDAGFSLLAVRLCGGIETKVPGFNAQEMSVRFEGSGQLDARLASYVQFSVRVEVWRLPVEIWYGAEVGLTYPIKVSLSGSAQPCWGKDPRSATYGKFVFPKYRVQIPIELGSLAFFATSTVGWGQFGFNYDIAGRFAPTWERSTSCTPWAVAERPGGSGDAQTNPRMPLEEIIPDLELSPVYRKLVESGLAVQNPAPTILEGTSEREEVRLVAALLEIVPGSGPFEHYRKSGALAALGIDPSLPPGSKVIVDVANASIQEVLGINLGRIVPKISLSAGAIVVGASYPVSPASFEYCSDPASSAAVAALHAQQCAEIDLADLVPRVRTQGEVALGVGALAPPDLSLATDLAESTASEVPKAVCGVATALDGPCADLRHAVAPATVDSDLAHLRSVHDTFVILDRPFEARWIISTCLAGRGVPELNAGIAVNEDPEGGQTVVDFGRETRVADCLEIPEGGGILTLDVGDVAQQYHDGNLILALFAVAAHERGAASSKGLGTATLEPLGPFPNPGPIVDSVICPLISGCAP